MLHMQSAVMYDDIMILCNVSFANSKSIGPFDLILILLGTCACSFQSGYAILELSRVSPPRSCWWYVLLSALLYTVDIAKNRK